MKMDNSKRKWEIENENGSQSQSSGMLRVATDGLPVAIAVQGWLSRKAERFGFRIQSVVRQGVGGQEG
jgi:hypothetical protein